MTLMCCPRLLLCQAQLQLQLVHLLLQHTPLLWILLLLKPGAESQQLHLLPVVLAGIAPIVI